MTKHMTGTRKEWLAARLELLEAEKELTRRSDELAQRRQDLPWVRIDKEYRFETDEGGASLTDLFRGRSQLLVYHFMFGPDYTAGCATCSTIADGFNGFVVHLTNHDVTLSAVSRAPLAKLQAYKRRMGWTFPWASSLGGDFNFDFNVSFTEEQQREGRIEYNYERDGHTMDAAQVPEPVADNAAMTGTDVARVVELRTCAASMVWPSRSCYSMRPSRCCSSVNEDIEVEVEVASARSKSMPLLRRSAQTHGPLTMVARAPLVIFSSITLWVEPLGRTPSSIRSRMACNPLTAPALSTPISLRSYPLSVLLKA